MVGQKIREARTAQRLSLAQVASKAAISVATLSRIETNKQGIEVELFLMLAKILNASASDLLGLDGQGDGQGDSLATRPAALAGFQRVKFWRDLSAAQTEPRSTGRQMPIRAITAQVDELLAQIDFLRQEVESIRKKLRPK